jgi:hypothetical protein
VKLKSSKPNIPVLPAHRFQSGDTVSLRPSKLPGGVSVNANASNEPSAGIVYRVEEDSITVAFTTLEEDLDGTLLQWSLSRCLPWKCSGTFTLQLLANDITYRRLRIAMEKLQKCSSGGRELERMLVVDRRCRRRLAPCSGSIRHAAAGF